MPVLTSILLVDDDATTNFLNKLLLQTMQVAEPVLIAENGAEALQTLHRTCITQLSAACPQLILLDMNMPVMNGLAFLEVLYATSRNPAPKHRYCHAHDLTARA